MKSSVLAEIMAKEQRFFSARELAEKTKDSSSRVSAALKVMIQSDKKYAMEIKPRIIRDEKKGIKGEPSKYMLVKTIEQKNKPDSTKRSKTKQLWDLAIFNKELEKK